MLKKAVKPFPRCFAVGLTGTVQSSEGKYCRSRNSTRCTWLWKRYRELKTEISYVLNCGYFDLSLMLFICLILDGSCFLGPGFLLSLNLTACWAVTRAYDYCSIARSIPLGKIVDRLHNSACRCLSDSWWTIIDFDKLSIIYSAASNPREPEYRRSLPTFPSRCARSGCPRSPPIIGASPVYPFRLVVRAFPHQ